MNFTAQRAGSYKDVSTKDKPAKWWWREEKNTGTCQQLQLPGAEIVKALHGKWADAQTKPRSFLHLKVQRGHKIKKKPSLHLALGRSCKTELSKDLLVVTVTEVAKLGMFGNQKSFVHIDLNFCPVQTGCLHMPSPSPSASFTHLLTSLFICYCFFHSPSPWNGTNSGHK